MSEEEDKFGVKVFGINIKIDGKKVCFYGIKAQSEAAAINICKLEHPLEYEVLKKSDKKEKDNNW